MIVGNGMIATAFESLHYGKNDNVVIFASGVSNSKEIDTSEFAKEKELLTQHLIQNTNRKFIYFSTCSIYDATLADSPYVKHKKDMEELIKNHSNNFVIFRLSQVVGKTKNRNLIVNFIYYKMLEDQLITVWKGSKRNLIDINDVVKIVHSIIERDLFKNSIVNVASAHNVDVLDIVAQLESILHKKAQVTLQNRNSSYDINIDEIAPLVKELGINFSQEYYKEILKKYYR